MKRGKFAVICIIMIAVFSFSGCGSKKDTPESLAKETLELTMQQEARPENSGEIQVKLDAIEAKVAKLSLSQQLAYSGELIKLTGEMIQGAFNSSEFQDGLEDLNDELKAAAKELENALEAVKDIEF